MAARGQHFLRRGALCSSLVARSCIGARDTVVEIGAGTGALTRPLARRAGRVVAVELDPALCDALRAGLGADPRVELVNADFLRWPLPPTPFKVFANVPFAHTSEILRRLTESDPGPSDVYVVVEHAAARRWAGTPFGPETLRSLLTKPWWHTELVCEIEPLEFAPPARTLCALLWLARRARPLVAREEAAAYADFVSAAFGRRGDRIDECLGDLLTHEQRRRSARLLHFDRAAPPSSLTFDQWLALYRCFVAHADPGAKNRIRGARDRLPR
ncbi:MAG TPA: rRNA adenine N(6)-methyltransferase family protein [Myxococcota bacterium]|nr:rRNA adenine N(6)-methyltransferase family protein [Myxococcota bacterium]